MCPCITDWTKWTILFLFLKSNVSFFDGVDKADTVECCSCFLRVMCTCITYWTKWKMLFLFPKSSVSLYHRLDKAGTFFLVS